MMIARKFLAMTLLLLLLAACGRGREEATPAPAATSAPAQTEVTTEETEEAEAPAEGEAAGENAPEAPASDNAVSAGNSDALTAITNAMQAQITGGPYRATTTIESEGIITEMVAEVVPPSRMHVTIGGGNMEMILLEDVLWQKTPDSEWVQMGSPELMQDIFDTIRGQSDGSMMTNIEYLGSEPVFGEQADMYTFTSVLGEGEDAISSDVILWISQTSGLPIRMESSSSAMGVLSTAVQTIEYDSAITVEAPQ